MSLGGGGGLRRKCQALLITIANGTSDAPTVVPRSEASAPPGNLLEMHIHLPPPAPPPHESLRGQDLPNRALTNLPNASDDNI